MLRSVGASSTNVFALPFGDFVDLLKIYLHDNWINYVYIVAVPVVAVFTTIGRTAQRIGRR